MKINTFDLETELCRYNLLPTPMWKVPDPTDIITPIDRSHITEKVNQVKYKYIPTNYNLHKKGLS